MSDDKPIIVIKKKGGHGGHHGGAWKIAYADFVTAMMAFFMVMWLVNSAEVSTKQSIASYFRKPGIFQEGSGTPLLIGEAGILEDAYVPAKDKTEQAIGHDQDRKPRIGGETEQGEFRGQGEEQGSGYIKPSERDIIDPTAELLFQQQMEQEQSRLEDIAEQIRQELKATPELAELLGVVDVKVESDGLNIEIMDTEKTSMFTSGSARILPETRTAFKKLSGILLKMPNKIDILGHTDATPFSTGAGGYSNWELSADRANAARRLLVESGIPKEQITGVVGRAAKDLKNPNKPFAAANRRITLKMKFNIPKTVDISKDPGALDQMFKSPAPAGSARPGQGEQAKQPVHSITPKEIIDGTRKRREKIPAPADSPPAAARRNKDRIFGNAPLFGPDDPFNGL